LSFFFRKGRGPSAAGERGKCVPFFLVRTRGEKGEHQASVSRKGSVALVFLLRLGKGGEKKGGKWKVTLERKRREGGLPLNSIPLLRGLGERKRAKKRNLKSPGKKIGGEGEIELP